MIMLITTVGAFIAIGLFSLMPFWALGVVFLALCGWLTVSSLLQYTLLQTQTPSDARAHKWFVDGAKRHWRCHWRGVVGGRWGR